MSQHREPELKRPTVMDVDAWKHAPKIYAQSVQVQITEEEAILTFSHTLQGVPVGAEGPDTQPSSLLVPQVLVILSIPHLKRLQGLMGEQIAKSEQELTRRAQASLIESEE